MTTVADRPPTRRRRLAGRCLVISLAAALLAPGVAADASPAAAAAAGESAPKWQILKPTNTGIPGDYVYSLALDAKDHAWVTADDPVYDEGGLGQLKGRQWRQWTNVDGKSPTGGISSVAFDKRGKAWMASGLGLLRLEQNMIKLIWSAENAPWPTSYVTDFDWDSKGNLWVSLGESSTVKGGVARYDGTRWKVWTTANGLPWEAPYDQVYELEIDDDDNVWIGSPITGGAMFDGTRWKALGGGWVFDIAIDDEGTPWYAFIAEGVKTWSGTGFVDRTGPFGSSDVGAVSVDRDGRVWISSFGGSVWRWSGTGSSWDVSYDPPSISNHMYALDFDSRNRLHVGGIGGLNVLEPDGTWSIYTTQNTALPSRTTKHITVGDDNHGWFSTTGGGLAEYDGKRWTDYNPANWGSAPWPFATDSVTSTAEAEDGTIWASPTGHGVGEWDGEQWVEHLPYARIQSLAIDPSGGVWAAPDRGPILRYDGTKWVNMGNPSGSVELGEIAADSAGNVWLTSMIGLFKWNGRNWRIYTPDNSGLPANYVTSVAPEPRGGGVWVGTIEGLARFDGGKEWTVYDESDGLPAKIIKSIAVAPNGHVWIGAFNGSIWPYYGGVGEFDGERWTSYTSENSPLQHEQVESVAVGKDGRVWISSASEGVAIVTP